MGDRYNLLNICTTLRNLIQHNYHYKAYHRVVSASLWHSLNKNELCNLLIGLLCWLVAGLPVQQLPVLSTPAVFEFLCVHPSNLIKIWLVDSKQAEAIYLPVTCRENNKNVKNNYECRCMPLHQQWLWYKESLMPIWVFFFFWWKLVYYECKMKTCVTNSKWIFLTEEWVSVMSQNM